MRRPDTNNNSRFRALSFLPSFLSSLHLPSSPDRTHSSQSPISLSSLPLGILRDPDPPENTRSSKKHTHTLGRRWRRKNCRTIYIYINPKLREREVQTARRSSFVGAISLNALTRLLLYVSNAVRNEDNILIRTGRDDGNARRRRNIGEHRRFNGAPVRKSHGKRARPASAETRLATPPTLFPGSLPGRTRPAGFEPFA